MAHTPAAQKGCPFMGIRCFAPSEHGDKCVLSCFEWCEEWVVIPGLQKFIERSSFKLFGPYFVLFKSLLAFFLRGESGMGADDYHLFAGVSALKLQCNPSSH